jgi:type II secretory pathway pseudopilin PulG
MSLVEVTIILMTLAILTAVAAPSIGDYVNDARQTKAKEDVEAIGTAVFRLVRDTGIPCVTKDATPKASACTGSGGNRVELLTSASAVGSDEPAVTASAFVPPAGTTSTDAGLNWAGGTGEIDEGYRDTMDNQLVTNTLSADDYDTVNFSAGGGPKAGLGWRGAYLSGPIGLDPWGYAYQASVIFLAPASDATGTGEGKTGWSSDVVVISAGLNGSIATSFGAFGTSASADDVIYVVTGATR